MNKQFITNTLALIIAILGYFLSNDLLLSVGLFALSGAVTNWLAVHMLFEKVPLLYGSGVVPDKFNEIKAAIKHMFMQQFFTKENIELLISNSVGDSSGNFEFKELIEGTDLNPAYDSLVDVIENSQFGAMLGMFGGSAVLEPLKAPFIEKMQSSLIEISTSEVFQKSIQQHLMAESSIEGLQEKIVNVIDHRLSELTPELVKELVQNMIAAHLGWLVVWGGVFGGLFGLLAHII